MIRIGRMESMHEDVKKISLTELARIHAQRIISDHKHKNMENIEARVTFFFFFLSFKFNLNNSNLIC